jgi:outer membrane protein assembly factor BamB
MKRSLLTVVACLAGTVGTRAGDWPMWRYDAARSAASPHEIATNLTLLWSRTLPPVQPAWPGEEGQRLNFDASYEPVVMGKSLFLGSPNDGSVTAYDTGTGEERWKVFTEGPVRCALACWNGRVYAGSDDGYLYCLDAQSGAVLWKIRGAPPDRPDRRHLGNEHLISLWPVRGGPVILDGIVYFGAGIWPTFGVFLHARDAATGKAKWTNGDLHHVQNARPTFELARNSALSPQGHLVALRDRLVVPNGRSMPAGLDPATGRLIYHLQGYRNGDSRVAAAGDYLFVGRDGVLNAYDFRETGSFWSYRGAEPPPDYNTLTGAAPGGLNWSKWRLDLAESPDPRTVGAYKTVPGCDAGSAFEAGRVYGSANGTFYAYDLAKAQPVETQFQMDKFLGGGKGRKLKWEPLPLWQLKTPQAGQPGSLVIKAGGRLYAGAGKKLLVLEQLTAEPRLAWEKDLGGRPSSLVAADNKLFVATAEGGLLCFGDAGPTPSAAKTHSHKAAAQDEKVDPWGGKAAQIVKASKVRAGYGLVLGLKDGRLIDELLRQTDLVVIGVDADAGKIDALRRRFEAAGALGSRVELFTGQPFQFGFPPYLASLIVSEDAPAAGFPGKAEAATLVQSLHPYGGTLCLDLPGDGHTAFAKWAKAAARPQGVVKQEGGLSLLVQAGALPGAAPWSHAAGDAARTYCSQDDRVRAPLGILWYGDRSGFQIFRAYALRPQVNNGQVYALRPHARTIDLQSYDAFTGRPLWNKTLASSTRGQACYAAMDDGLYVARDGLCEIRDPASGEVQKTFTFNASGAICARDLRVDGDAIVVACDTVRTNDIDPDYWNTSRLESSMLVGLDRRSGVVLWRRTAAQRFNNDGLALGTGLVFCVDSVPTTGANRSRWKHLETLKTCESTILALDARTGAVVWSHRVSYPHTNRWGIDEWLAYSADTGVLLGGRLTKAHAWDALTGRPLWGDKPVERGPLILRGKTFTGFLCSFNERERDILTGEPTGRESLLGFNGHDCNSPLGGQHLLFVRDGTISYADLESEQRFYLRNVRSGCVNSLIAAEGLLNVPNMSGGCTCNYPLQTSFAMVHMPEVAAWDSGAPSIATPPPARPERMWHPDPPKQQP